MADSSDVTPSVPDPIEPKESIRIPRWLAALPGLLLVTFFAVRAMIQMGGASQAISGGNESSKPSLACVSTYGITLTNSEYYVPEGHQFSPPPKTPELSTVVSGMVRNDCGEALKAVRIHLKVSDENGRKGEGSALVTGLNPGEAKPFDKAWMGRITSYEVDSIK